MNNDNHIIKYAVYIELKNNIGKYITYDKTYFRYNDEWKIYKAISVNRIKKAKYTAKELNPNDITYLCVNDVPKYKIDYKKKNGGYGIKFLLRIGNNELYTWTCVEGGKQKELAIDYGKYAKILAEYYIDDKYHRHIVSQW